MANMTTKALPTGPGFDALVRVLRADRIARLEAKVKEQEQTISDLLDRLSEARRKAAEA